MADFAVVHLDAADGGCIVCGKPLGPPKYAVPLYEGLVLPNDWEGEWAGFDACERCYHVQGRITEPVTPEELIERAGRGL